MATHVPRLTIHDSRFTIHDSRFTSHDIYPRANTIFTGKGRYICCTVGMSLHWYVIGCSKCRKGKYKTPFMKKRIVIVTPFICLLALLFTLDACKKEYSVETGASLAAQGSLYDSLGNCMADSTVGTFYNGVIPNGSLAQANDTAYVLAKVNVTVAGSYNITSTIQNGMYFSDSGYFTSTGINTIKLYPVGTPIIPGTFNYSITFDSTTCSFVVVTKDSTGRSGGGTTVTNPNTSDTAWKFTSPAGNFHGSIDTAYTFDSLGTKNLAIIGRNKGDSTFFVGSILATGAIATGTYNTSSLAVFGFNDVAQNTIYAANPRTAGVNTAITITSYNTTTKVLTGTFTGNALDALGRTVTVTLGSFTVRVH